MIDCRSRKQREYDEEAGYEGVGAVAQEDRRRGVPRSDIERVAKHYGISLEEAQYWLTIHPVEELLPERGAGIERGTAAALPSVFEKAFAVPALANPRLVPFDTVPSPYIDIKPTSFRPSDRIDLAVEYKASNDEESAWQTCVVVKMGTTKLVKERQHHYQMHPDKSHADCDTGMSMPSTPVTLEVEVWAHPDELETSWPDP